MFYAMRNKLWPLGRNWQWKLRLMLVTRLRVHLEAAHNGF